MLSPFITSVSGPSCAPSPTCAPYSTVQRGPRVTRLPIFTWSIFITRSSNRCVCGQHMAFSSLYSPICTQSNSVMSVVSRYTPRSMRAPSSRKASFSHGVPRR